MNIGIIEQEFNKNPTLMSLLKKWHQSTPIQYDELCHFKALYKGNHDHIKKFKMSFKQFNSFDELYIALNDINKKTKKVYNHPFFYFNDEAFYNFLENSDINYFKTENGNTVAIVDSFEKSNMLSPVNWCIQRDETQFKNYTSGSGKVFILFDKINNTIIGASVSHVLFSFNEDNIEVETPNELINVLKPIVRKNFLKSIFKFPLIASFIFSGAITLLFSEISLNFNFQAFLEIEHIANFCLFTIVFAFSFTMLTSPPYVRQKRRENFVFLGFLITISTLMISILGHMKTQEYLSLNELNEISKNPESAFTHYEIWQTQDNIVFKNFPAFIKYEDNIVKCTEDFHIIYNNIENIREKSNYCYFEKHKI